MGAKFNADLDYYKNLSDPVFEAQRKKDGLAVEKERAFEKGMKKAEDTYKVISKEPLQIFRTPSVHKADGDNVSGTIIKAIDRLNTNDELKKAQDGMKEQEIMKTAYKNAEDVSGLLA
jgi:hypothetical protein